MPCCVAIGCSTKECDKKAVPPITFHCFPSNQAEKDKWIQSIGRKNWKPSKRSVVCSKHFPVEDLDRSSPFMTKLKKGVVPSIFQQLSDKPAKKRKAKHGLLKEKSLSPIKEEFPEINSPSPIKEESPEPDSVTPIKVEFPRAESPSPSKEELKNMLMSAKTKTFELEKQLGEALALLQKTTLELYCTKDLLAKKRKDVKSLHQRTRRYVKRNCVLKAIISELKNKVCSDTSFQLVS